MKKLILFLFIFVFTLSFTGCDVTSALPGGTVVRYDGAEDYAMGGVELDVDVETIEIDWISGSIDIRHHDGDTVIVEEKGNRMLNENTSLYYRVEEKNLKLQFAKSDAWIEDGLRKDLTVFLPRRLEQATAIAIPYDLSIENVASDITVSLDALEELDIESVSGKVEIYAANWIQELDLETVSGAVNVKAAVIGTCDLATVSADVTLTTTRSVRTLSGPYSSVTMPLASIDELDAESVSGDITLYLHESSDFEVEFESLSGELHCDFTGELADVYRRGKVYTAGAGNSKFDVETVSGGLYIHICQTDAS